MPETASIFSRLKDQLSNGRHPERDAQILQACAQLVRSQDHLAHCADGMTTLSLYPRKTDMEKPYFKEYFDGSGTCVTMSLSTITGAESVQASDWIANGKITYPLLIDALTKLAYQGKQIKLVTSYAALAGELESGQCEGVITLQQNHISAAVPLTGIFFKPPNTPEEADYQEGPELTIDAFLSRVEDGSEVGTYPYVFAADSSSNENCGTHNIMSYVADIATRPPFKEQRPLIMSLQRMPVELHAQVMASCYRYETEYAAPNRRASLLDIADILGEHTATVDASEQVCIAAEPRSHFAVNYSLFQEEQDVLPTALHPENLPYGVHHSIDFKPQYDTPRELWEYQLNAKL
jgi:hypothetical protein